MRVLVTRKNRRAPTDKDDTLGVVMTDLETILQKSDYVSLHLPLNAATYHTIDGAALAEMKPSAYLIDTSRGALVDEQSLADAIHSGRLAGAAIDTYEQIDVFTDMIPPRLHPLMGLENVILTPYVAMGPVQSAIDILKIAVDNVVDILNGYWPPPENIVNPRAMSRYPMQEKGW